MDWNEVLADPSLQDLPYKIETNEWGEIVMTPAKNWHSRMQARVMRRLDLLIPDGETIPECAVQTPSGVKVADVAWLSSAFLQINTEADPYQEAPDLCVEVVSPSNSTRQMNAKAQLYFAQGAKEVWFATEKGAVRFFAPDGEMATSRLFLAFPNSLPPP